ncbi:MAG: hypothetical protein AB8B51_17425 [Sedimentitalea sp.]
MGLSISFYPKKNAMVQTTMDALGDDLGVQFKNVSAAKDVAKRFEDAFKSYDKLLRDKPTISDILSSRQRDKTPRALEQKDSRRNGKMFFNLVAPFVPDANNEAFGVVRFVSAHLSGSLARLCSRVGRKTAAVVQDQFIASVQRDLSFCRTDK